MADKLAFTLIAVGTTATLVLRARARAAHVKDGNAAVAPRGLRPVKVSAEQAAEAEAAVELEIKPSARTVNLSNRMLPVVPRSLLSAASGSARADLAVALRVLDLSRNMLAEVPAALYELRSLRTLDISRNKLRSMAPGVSVLTQLESLSLLGNSLKVHTLPLEELAALPALRPGGVDLRYNKKVERQVARARVIAALGDRVVVGNTSAVGRAAREREEGPSGGIAGEHACDRDATQLAAQLAPISTPQLRRRLEETFGVCIEPDVGRAFILERLLKCYAAHGPRRVRRVRGTRVDADVVAALTQELRTLSWPARRERPKVAASSYFTLNRPQSGRFSTETSEGAKRAAAKLARYRRLWDLSNRAMRSVDPLFAERYSALAVTRQFTGSPHVDTENIGPFYGISLGEFRGGRIAVESSPLEVTEIDTRGRLGRVDGRWPHWVTPYEGERYSVIFYRTEGSVDPMTTAVFEDNIEEAGRS